MRSMPPTRVTNATEIIACPLRFLPPRGIRTSLKGPFGRGRRHARRACIAQQAVSSGPAVAGELDPLVDRTQNHGAVDRFEPERVVETARLGEDPLEAPPGVVL